MLLCDSVLPYAVSSTPDLPEHHRGSGRGQLQLPFANFFQLTLKATQYLCL